jgi:alkyl sulfatase BDS1-like metallo-beta-lactamase superfamily hydrolase
VKVQNGVLHHWTRHTRDADLTLTLTKAQLVMALLQPDTLDKGIADGSITAEGDTTILRTLTGLLDTFDPQFNVVTPNATP